MVTWKFRQGKYQETWIAYVGKWPVGSVFYDGMVSRGDPKVWKAVAALPMIKITEKHYERREQAMSIVVAVVKYWFKAAGMRLPIKRRKRVIGIVGTRRRNSDYDFRLVENEFLRHYREGDTICSGLCPKGADRFAVILSEKYHASARWYKANWQRDGKAAGFVRNTYIAEDSNVLIACVASDRKGGTEDTLRKFRKAGKRNWYIV